MNINERIFEYLQKQDAEREDPSTREFTNVEVKDINIRDLGPSRVYYSVRQYPGITFAVYYSRLDMVVPPTEESMSVNVDTTLLQQPDPEPEGAAAGDTSGGDGTVGGDGTDDSTDDGTLQSQEMPIVPAPAPVDPGTCAGVKGDGTPCTRGAGWGTEHKGTGNCRQHESA